MLISRKGSVGNVREVPRVRGGDDSSPTISIQLMGCFLAMLNLEAFHCEQVLVSLQDQFAGGSSNGTSIRHGVP